MDHVFAELSEHHTWLLTVFLFFFFMASFCLVCCCSPHVRPKALIERVWLCGEVGNVEGSVTKLFPSLVPVPAENLRAASYFPYDFSLHSTLPAALFCP